MTDYVENDPDATIGELKHELRGLRVYVQALKLSSVCKQCNTVCIDGEGKCCCTRDNINCFSKKDNIVDLVKDDLEARAVQGEKTYGTRLKPFNGRDGLQDLYEELLDACCYLRQVMFEEKNK